MAKAPRPGVGRRADEVKTAKVVRKLRIRDETRTLALANIPIKDRLDVRKATGYSVEDLLLGESFGVDSLMVAWWLAGRANGQPLLTLEQVDAEWPSDLEATDIEFTEVTREDEDGDDPQS
jgi:hypothetical protein